MPDGSSSAAPVINPGPRMRRNLLKRRVLCLGDFFSVFVSILRGELRILNYNTEQEDGGLIGMAQKQPPRRRWLFSF